MAPMARHATITTLSFCPKGARTVAETVEQAVTWIDLAAHDKPDLIVLPEAFAAGNEQCRASKANFCASAEPIDGPTVGRMAACARQHRCYIAAPVVLERDQKRTNSIVMLDRDGQIAAVYEKNFPPIYELESGRNVMPGTEPTIVETDFGRVGLLICFDLNFQELRHTYEQLGPQLLVFCSLFEGGMLTRIWALLNGCYFVSSFPGNGSVFVNPLGRLLAESSVPNSRILTRRLNLDFQVLHGDYNQRKLDELRRHCGDRIDLELHEPEGRMLLTSTDDATSAADVCKQLELEPIDAFFARSRAARSQALAEGPIPEGPPQW